MKHTPSWIRDEKYKVYIVLHLKPVKLLDFRIGVLLSFLNGDRFHQKIAHVTKSYETITRPTRKLFQKTHCVPHLLCASRKMIQTIITLVHVPNKSQSKGVVWFHTNDPLETPLKISICYPQQFFQYHPKSQPFFFGLRLAHWPAVILSTMSVLANNTPFQFCQRCELSFLLHKLILAGDLW